MVKYKYICIFKDGTTEMKKCIKMYRSPFVH